MSLPGAFSEPLQFRQWENGDCVIEIQLNHISIKYICTCKMKQNYKTINYYFYNIHTFFYLFGWLNYLEVHLPCFLVWRNHLILVKCSQSELPWGPHPDQAANQGYFTCNSTCANCCQKVDTVSKACAVLGSQCPPQALHNHHEAIHWNNSIETLIYIPFLFYILCKPIYYYLMSTLFYFYKHTN